MTDFSTMTDSQLDEWLAVNVMGWHLTVYGMVGHWENDNGWFMANANIPTNRSEVPHWNPADPEHLHQAVDCAEKWKKVAEERNIEIVYTWSGYRIQLRIGNKIVGESKVDEFARALCEAVAMAVEGEG